MQRHFVQIAKALGIDLKTLEGVVEVIGTSIPSRAAKYSNERHRRRRLRAQGGDEYVIVLNEDGMPAAYQRQLPGHAQLDGLEVGRRDGQLHQDKIRSAVWLIKSSTSASAPSTSGRLHREAPARVPGAGIDYLRPLVRDVADDIQMHDRPYPCRV